MSRVSRGHMTIFVETETYQAVRNTANYSLLCFRVAGKDHSQSLFTTRNSDLQLRILSCKSEFWVAAQNSQLQEFWVRTQNSDLQLRILSCNSEFGLVQLRILSSNSEFWVVIQNSELYVRILSCKSEFWVVRQNIPTACWDQPLQRILNTSQSDDWDQRLHVNIPKVRYSDMGNKAE